MAEKNIDTNNASIDYSYASPDSIALGDFSEALTPKKGPENPKKLSDNPDIAKLQKSIYDQLGINPDTDKNSALLKILKGLIDKLIISNAEFFIQMKNLSPEKIKEACQNIKVNFYTLLKDLLNTLPDDLSKLLSADTYKFGEGIAANLPIGKLLGVVGKGVGLAMAPIAVGIKQVDNGVQILARAPLDARGKRLNELLSNPNEYASELLYRFQPTRSSENPIERHLATIIERIKQDGRNFTLTALGDLREKIMTGKLASEDMITMGEFDFLAKAVKRINQDIENSRAPYSRFSNPGEQIVRNSAQRLR